VQTRETRRLITKLREEKAINESEIVGTRGLGESAFFREIAIILFFFVLVWVTRGRRSLGLQHTCLLEQAQDLPEHRSVITQGPKMIVTVLQIPIDRLPREVSGPEVASLEPLVQVGQKTKMVLGRSGCVALFRQERLVSGRNATQRALGKPGSKVGSNGEGGHDVSSYDGIA
jgi:hypothetical protein